MTVGRADKDGEVPGAGAFPYGSAAAFRAALKDRFAAIAKADDRYTVDELQRQFAYGRALARLFTAPEADSWVLKGAGALLARLEQARHSKDIDVCYTEQPSAVPEAVSAPRIAVLAGAAHRALALPLSFAVPDEVVWRRGYPNSAADAPGPMPTFDEAVALACALLNPILDGPVTVDWDPVAVTWR